jgi:hypothetical protein
MYISNAEHTKPPYSPGVKRWSLYRSLWLKYSKPFFSGYTTHFQSQFGGLYDEKIDEVKKLIECGEFYNGFVVHSCLHCGIKFKGLFYSESIVFKGLVSDKDLYAL